MPAHAPLWRCPKCGHRFVTRNLSHSCGRHRLSVHFAGKPRALRETFRAWVAAARACGPVTVYAQKTRIVMMVRVRFSGITVRARWLDAHLWMRSHVTHPRLHRTEDFGHIGLVHHFRLEQPSDVDDALRELMRASYRVGTQSGLTFADAAALARRLPGVAESTSYGTPALKVDGKFMARLKEDGETLVIKVDMTSRDFLLRDEPKLFYITDHYRDYPAVLVRLPVVTEPRLTELLEDAWRLVAPPKRRAQIDGTGR